MIMDWPEGKAFWILPEEEVTHAEEALKNVLPEKEKQHALFTDGLYSIEGNLVTNDKENK